jgi:type IV/VI secretion system ImpK/VasF family protein
MNLKVWQELVASYREMSELIAATTPEAAAGDLDGMRPLLGNDAMETLHGELRQTVARAAAKLAPLLDSAELQQILFILTIAIDEKVQRRLAPEEAPKWPLLQRALFDVHDGGDLFYDLIDDCLARNDTPYLVFEICYFCLSDGFVGRHSRNRPMIEEYKRKIAGRLPRSQSSETGYFTTAYNPTTGAARLPLRYYLYAAGALLLLPFVLLLVW